MWLLWLLCSDHLDLLQFALMSTSASGPLCPQISVRARRMVPDSASFASAALLRAAMKMRRTKKTPAFFSCHVCTEEPEKKNNHHISHQCRIIGSQMLHTSGCSTDHIHVGAEVSTAAGTGLTLLSRTRLRVVPVSSSRVSAAAAFKVSGSRRPRHPAESPLRQKTVKGTEEWTARCKTAGGEHTAVLSSGPGLDFRNACKGPF